MDPATKLLHDVLVYPPIKKGTRHFCSLVCLKGHVTQL